MAQNAPQQSHGSIHEDLATVLEDERTLRHFTEHVLDCRQKELERKEAENMKLVKKLGHLAKELSDIRTQLQEIQGQSTTAKDKNLRESVDLAFNIQNCREDITDSDVRESYRALCDKIQRWVESKLPSSLETISQGHIKKPAAAQAAKLLSLLREPAKRCVSVHYSDRYHVVAAINYYLWLAFFSKPFYCPLDDFNGDSRIHWIASIESSMAKLQRGWCEIAEPCPSTFFVC